MIEEKGLEEEKADKIGKFVCRGSMGAGKRMDPKQMHATLMEEGVFGTHKGALEAMEQLAKLWDYLDAMGSLKCVFALFVAPTTAATLSILPLIATTNNTCPLMHLICSRG